MNISVGFFLSNLFVLSSSGMYIRALADGVAEVLSDYRGQVVQLEISFLHKPMAAIAELTTELDEWFPVLRGLQSRIFRVHNEKMHGCHLLR